MSKKSYRGRFNYLQRQNANSEADYGNELGKKKKPYRVKNHLEKENYHQGNFPPYGYARIGRNSTNSRFAPITGLGNGCCFGLSIGGVGGTIFGSNPSPWVLEDENGRQFVRLEATVPGTKVFWSLNQWAATSGELLFTGWADTLRRGEACPISTNVYYPSDTSTSCGLEEDIIDEIRITDENGCEDIGTVGGDAEDSEFTSGLNSSIKTGSGCTATYVMKGDAGSAFPISDFEVQSYCPGDEPSEWTGFAGTLVDTNSEINIAYHFGKARYRGYDACGELVVLDGPSKGCVTCGGGSTVTGPDEVGSCGGSAQYSWDGSAVTWTVSGEVGEGGGISSTGFLTTGAGCCGSVIVKAKNGCCAGDIAVRMEGGDWFDETVVCSQGGSTPNSCTTIIGDTKTEYKGSCLSPGACTVANGWLCAGAKPPIDCGCGTNQLCPVKVTTWKWRCAE